MRISVNGFSKYADTLHVNIPKRADWEVFRNILSISGVRYYYARADIIGIRYNDLVDPIDVAAQVLVVAAAFCETPLDKVEVVVKERSKGVDESKVAAEIRSRMLAMSAPAEVPVHQVEPRGAGPAYWLK